MKKNLVLLLQWNSVFVSYVMTPFLLGYIAVLTVQNQAEFGFLRPFFEQPFHLRPWGMVAGAAGLGFLLWPWVARYDLRTSHWSWALLFWASVMLIVNRPEWGVVEYLRTTVTIPLYVFLIFLYLLRFVMLFPGLRERTKFA